MVLRPKGLVCEGAVCEGAVKGLYVKGLCLLRVCASARDAFRFSQRRHAFRQRGISGGLHARGSVASGSESARRALWAGSEERRAAGRRDALRKGASEAATRRHAGVGDTARGVGEAARGGARGATARARAGGGRGRERRHPRRHARGSVPSGSESARRALWAGSEERRRRGRRDAVSSVSWTQRR
jgi:hypothetical protein